MKKEREKPENYIEQKFKNTKTTIIILQNIGTSTAKQIKHTTRTTTPTQATYTRTSQHYTTNRGTKTEH